MSSLDDRRRSLTADGQSAADRGGAFGWLSNHAHAFVMALLFVGASVLGWSLLPGEDERIAALERDGQTRRALELLQGRFDRGDRRQRTLVQLQRFYEYYGDTNKMRAVLELLALQRPRDLYVQRQLSKLYRQIQDEPSEMLALRAQLAIRYSEPVCFRLIGLLRFNGDHDSEQKALLDCRANGYRRPEELTRLAFLVAADGNTAESARILAAVDDRRWLRDSRERLMLFETLLEAKRFDDALRRATRWLKGQPDEELALQIIARFVESDRNDLALNLASAVGQSGDSVSLAVGEILVEQFQLGAARTFLRGWLEQAGPHSDLASGEVAGRFVSAAVDAGDAALALRAAERHGLERMSQSDLALIAEAIAADGNAIGFDQVRVHITQETLTQNALVAASVEIREGRLEIARLMLGRVRPDTLDERRLTVFERIVGQLGRPRAPGVVLREPVRAPGAFPPPDVTITAPEVQSRRITTPQDVSKRFRLKRKRPEPKAAAPAQNKSSQPVPFKFPIQ